jgi:hypothetical protein
MLARTASHDLPSETIGEVLNRLLEEGFYYIDGFEFIEFFGIEGRP